METFSGLLALAVRGIHRSPVNSPHEGMWREALMFSLICALNKRLSKQSWGRWFETPSRSWWRHCNETCMTRYFYKINTTLGDPMVSRAHSPWLSNGRVSGREKSSVSKLSPCCHQIIMSATNICDYTIFIVQWATSSSFHYGDVRHMSVIRDVHVSNYRHMDYLLNSLIRQTTN